MTPNLLILPVILPMLTGVLCLLCSRHEKLQAWVFIVGQAACLAGALAVFSGMYDEGYLVLQLGNWEPPYGIVLVADILSAIMVLISCLLGFLVGIYSLSDIPQRLRKAHFFSLFCFLLMGVNGAFLTGDLFNLYVWFEVMLISSFVLLVLGGERQQLEGGLKYVALNLFSSALFLTAAGLVYSKTGTLNMADIAQRLADHQSAYFLESTAFLLMISFGLKAAMFPLFFWLPASYHTAPPTVSAIFAGLLTKVGVYALIRLFTLLYYTDASDARELLLWIAALTMITGVFGAAAQFNIRKILSFHIVSQIGYMLLGLAIATPLALAGTIFYLVHHIIVKTNLFLIAGEVEKHCGSGNLEQTGGLYARLPMLAVLFFIPAFSLGGIPPLSGFWAKFALVKSAVMESYYWLAAVALIVGLMTLFSMTKIWNEAFLKANTSPAAKEPLSVSGNMRIPIIVMAGMTLVLGFFGEPMFKLSERASEQLLNPEEYIEVVLNNGRDEYRD